MHLSYMQLDPSELKKLSGINLSRQIRKSLQETSPERRILSIANDIIFLIFISFLF